MTDGAETIITSEITATMLERGEEGRIEEMGEREEEMGGKVVSSDSSSYDLLLRASPSRRPKDQTV